MPIGENDIIRVACGFRHSTGGQQVNVYHLRVTDPGDPVDDDAILEDIVDYFDNLYGVINTDVSNKVAYTEIGLFNESQMYSYAPYLWPTRTTGAATGSDSLPPQVAAFVRGTTGYSRNWMKKWLPTFGEETTQGDGKFNTTTMGHLTTFAGNFTDQFTVGNAGIAEFVVWHKDTMGFHKVTGARVSDIPGTMQRRKPGRGS
jgi:hypothetical protein